MFKRASELANRGGHHGRAGNARDNEENRLALSCKKPRVHQISGPCSQAQPDQVSSQPLQPSKSATSLLPLQQSRFQSLSAPLHNTSNDQHCKPFPSLGRHQQCSQGSASSPASASLSWTWPDQTGPSCIEEVMQTNQQQQTGPQAGAIMSHKTGQTQSLPSQRQTRMSTITTNSAVSTLHIYTVQHQKLVSPCTTPKAHMPCQSERNRAPLLRQALNEWDLPDAVVQVRHSAPAMRNAS